MEMLVANRRSYTRFIASLLLLAATHASATGSQAVDITATVTPNPVVANKTARISFSVTAHPPATGTPTGSVDITDGATTVCSVNLPNTNCTFTVSSSTSFVVFYNGDANFASNGISKTISVVPQTTTTLTSGRNPITVGQTVSFTAFVNGASPTGSMTIKDGNNVLCGNLAMSNAKATCSSTSLVAGNHSMTAVYSGDANNGGSTSATYVQVVQNAAPVNLDQFGLSGTWYNPATSGQGFLFSFYPDLGGAGAGFLAGGWFTYDVAPVGQANKERWYTITGNAPTAAASAQVDILESVGGNFNAPPKIPTVKVGSGTLQFSDCSTGSLSYSFSDGSGRSGTIPLSRLTANVNCGTAGDNSSAPGVYLLSGAWYDPNTSGQGLFFEMNSTQNYLSAAWYTYAPTGSGGDPSVSQRWYALQAPFTAGSSVITNIGIFRSIGGIFDDPTTPMQQQVGTATLTFQSCTTATLSFSFLSGINAAATGTINLQRIASPPPGCNL